jgi:hypothetical protein
MTLADLYDHVISSFPPHVQKDVKTAILVLARALECSHPAQCALDHYNRPLSELYTLVEGYLRAQGKKPHTIRNIKNYLSRFFRLAEDAHLFSLRPVKLLRTYDISDKPLRPGGNASERTGTYLPYRQWPIDLQKAFTAFHTWATAPFVPGRDAKLRKRDSTLDCYRNSFEGYFGYLSHIQQRVPAFDDLFDLDLIRAYVHWHVNERHQRATVTIHSFLRSLLAILRQYRPMPALREEILKFKKTIPDPSFHYDKSHAWVSLATLEDLGRALWPTKKPTDILMTKQGNQGGAIFASQAAHALIFRLWTYIPYRVRNIREMQLEENLRKVNGHWHIIFRGEQLKIALRNGQPNIFDLPFPPKLVPMLEDYLRLWRPIHLAKSPHPAQERHVFLTRHGTPHQAQSFAKASRDILYRYTGLHWHPHIVRTVWATEMILKGVDLLKVAMMLNDKLETVVTTYAHLMHQNVAEEIYALIDRDNGQGRQAS